MTLLFFILVPVVLVWAYGQMVRRVVDDPLIDGLIEANRARPRPGMGAADPALIGAWGARNAEDFWRAEGRIQ